MSLSPCKKQACALQSCLVKNNYSESACSDAINRLYACCDTFYANNGNDAKTPCCPSPGTLFLKMRQQRETKKV